MVRRGDARLSWKGDATWKVTGERTSHVVHTVVGCMFLLVLGPHDVF